MKALFAVLSLYVFTLSAFAGAPVGISLDVDAREISRSLLHARLEIPAKPGELVVWYPKWIPGVHAPAGPVQNLAGLRFESAAGDILEWKRDEVEMNRFLITDKKFLFAYAWGEGPNQHCGLIKATAT